MVWERSFKRLDALLEQLKPAWGGSNGNKKRS
jgi:hypothetical protein